MKIVSIGAVLMDQIASVNRFPGDDDEVFVPKLQLLPGGSAANFAVFCARLGLDSAFVGKVGRDALGDGLVADLDRERVDTANVSRSQLATGTVFVALKQNGQRAMFAYSGAANDLKSADLNTTYLNSYDHLHLADLENTDVLEYAAKSFKGTISMNPGALIAEKKAAAKALISRLDILVCAEAEAKKLSGEKSVKAAIQKLHKMGAKLIVVTRGAEPPMAFDGHRIVEAPTFKIKPVDTTGAGDSFSAGFISHYLKTWDLKKSLIFGNAVAAIVIQHHGARGGLRDEKQVEALINSKKAWHS